MYCSGSGSVSALSAATLTRVYDIYSAASSPKRLYLSELYASMDNTVAWIDAPINWILRRFTSGPPTGGSSSAPVAADGEDASPVTLGLQAGTGGSATFANLLNQYRAIRLPFEWKCLCPGKELKSAAANSNGLELTAQAILATGGAFATMLFEE